MPSRRRGTALESAILAAASDELDAIGYAAFTVGAVAQRSMTSKAVLYRRWRDRADLVAAVLRHRLPEPDEVVDTGTLRGDLVALLDALAERQPPADVVWGLLTETARLPGRLDEVRELLSVVAPGGPVIKLLERAIARGELPSMPPPRVISLPIDLARTELLLTGRITRESIDSIVDDVVLPVLSARR